MPAETLPYDTAAFLDTPERVIAYLDAVLEENDPDLIAHALGVVSRAAGTIQAAASAGSPVAGILPPAAARPDGQLSALIGVLKVFGLRLGVRPVEADAAE